MQEIDPHILQHMQQAPDWSLALGTVGRILVFLGIGFFAAAVLGWLAAPKLEFGKLVGKWGFVIGSLCLFGTFVVLATLFVNNRFEFPYVAGHGDSKNPFLYRVAGVWSGQEGSFLLWAVASAAFGLLTFWKTGIYQRWYTLFYALFLGSLCGILAYESPFKIEAFHGKFIVPPDGQGLAPSLQNYWVIIHPPTIFLGFGSLTVLFCYALSALLNLQPIEWAKMVRPWALVSLTLVGVGLSMGGLWAYETLGWGGFWKWDPVENTSFVPFILTGILVHGLIVQVNRGKWTITNLFMGGAPFLAFVYGTFLTRSGLLGETSVHSFAEMNKGSLWLLIGLGTAGIIGFAIVWTIRAFQLRKKYAVEGDVRPGFTREATYRWGSILLFGLALATAFGMSVPMVSGLLGKTQSVIEEPQYHQVVVWFMIPLMLLMAAAPYIAWGGVGFRRLFERLYGPACIAFGLTGLTLLLLMWSPWASLGPFTDTVPFFFGYKFPIIGVIKVSSLTWTLILAGFCYFVVTVSLWTIFERFKTSKEAISIYLSHVGVGVLLAGLILSRGLERTQQIQLQPSKPVVAMGYVLSYEGMTHDLADRRNKVLVKLDPLPDPGGPSKKVAANGIGGIGARKAYEADPGLYYMEDSTGQLNPMVWPSIHHGLLNDLYLALHPMAFDASDLQHMPIGKTVRFSNYLVTYEGMTREGEAGMEGTKFGAKLKVHDMTGEFRELVPKMKVTSAGPASEPAKLDEDYSISLERMNAADKSVEIQFRFNEPVFPIELFYKPFTSLVWGGLGILALGGFMAAWHRRYRPKLATSEIQTDAAVE